MTLGGSKMSKTRGNVQGPSGLIDAHGADAVRLFILFMGPADQDMEWTPSGIEGISRFLRRLWRVVHEVAETSAGAEAGGGELTRKAHATIAKVTDDVGRRFQFHTPISAVRELVNELVDDPGAPRRAVRRRDRRLADPAVRAAHRGRAVGRAGARAAVGGAVAVV